MGWAGFSIEKHQDHHENHCADNCLEHDSQDYGIDRIWQREKSWHCTNGIIVRTEDSYAFGRFDTGFRPIQRPKPSLFTGR